MDVTSHLCLDEVAFVPDTGGHKSKVCLNKSVSTVFPRDETRLTLVGGARVAVSQMHGIKVRGSASLPKSRSYRSCLRLPPYETVLRLHHPPRRVCSFCFGSGPRRPRSRLSWSGFTSPRHLSAVDSELQQQHRCVQVCPPRRHVGVKPAISGLLRSQISFADGFHPYPRFGEEEVPHWLRRPLQHPFVRSLHPG